VIHANDRILHEFMLSPISWKPEEVMTSIKESKILKRVNIHALILRYLLNNSVIDQRYFTVKELIETMLLLVTKPKKSMKNYQHFI